MEWMGMTRMVGDTSRITPGLGGTGKEGGLVCGERGRLRIQDDRQRKQTHKEHTQPPTTHTTHSPHTRSPHAPVKGHASRREVQRAPNTVKRARPLPQHRLTHSRQVVQEGRAQRARGGGCAAATTAARDGAATTAAAAAAMVGVAGGCGGRVEGSEGGHQLPPVGVQVPGAACYGVCRMSIC